MIRNSKLEIRNSLTKNRTFFVKVFGCQYNEWDGDKLTHLLKNIGLTESTEKEAGIIFLINCSVRKSAVDRALGVAENLRNLDKKVIASGCLLSKDKKRFKDKGALVWSDDDLGELADLLEMELRPIDREKAHSAGLELNLIPIMKGCNNFCSYCVVPYTRGREISRPFNEIIADAEKIVQSGQKEIWLLGQNVNSYEFGFVRLLERINDIDGDFQIFFTSNHPKDMSGEIILAIKSLSKVAKIIHLPVQSGSDEVLRSMNRPYSRYQYLKLVEKIKNTIPEIQITTDFIVGYPTETEEDFLDSVELAQKVNFYQAFVNKYSPREGTKSFSLGDPIPWTEKQRRWRILNDLINKQNK